MATDNRRVSVPRQEQEISYLDKEGQEHPLGMVFKDRYGNDGVSRILFTPANDNPFRGRTRGDEGYRLGVGSDRLTLINPADFQRPLLERGWTAFDQFVVGGGAELTTIYARPETEFTDPIMWDQSVWGQQVGQIFPAVRLNTSLYVGRPAGSLTFGFFRKVCGNGLITSLMDIGHYVWKHNAWSPEKYEEVLVSKDDGGVYPEAGEAMPLGPEIGTFGGTFVGVQLLRDYIEERDVTKELSPRMRLLEKNFKGFSPTIMPKWLLTGMTEQLGVMSEALMEEQRPIHVMDVVNAYTSAMNLHRNENPKNGDSGTWPAYENMSRVVGTIQSLAQMATIFSKS